MRALSGLGARAPGTEDAIREKDVIRMLRDAFPSAGLGDDTAVFQREAGETLFASDAVVEGVHFRKEYSSPGQAVQKAISSCVSDVYAMGGTPEKILVTAGLPEGTGEGAVTGIVAGIAAACAVYDIQLAGGDTVFSPGGTFFDISIIGRSGVGGAVLRNGATAGDLIFVTGECGYSLAGLRLLGMLFDGGGAEDPLSALLPLSKEERDEMISIIGSLSLLTTADGIFSLCGKKGLGASAALALLMIQKQIVPRAEGSPCLGRPDGVTAMIDVSDGLSRDLSTLCEESSAGALVREEDLPLPEALKGLPGAAPEYLAGLALESGEEYCRIFTARGDPANIPEGAAICIGEITPSGGAVLRSRDGVTRSLGGGGYEHFFGRR